jgi:hypothetical protein
VTGIIAERSWVLPTLGCPHDRPDMILLAGGN